MLDGIPRSGVLWVHFTLEPHMGLKNFLRVNIVISILVISISCVSPISTPPALVIIEKGRENRHRLHEENIYIGIIKEIEIKNYEHSFYKLYTSKNDFKTNYNYELQKLLKPKNGLNNLKFEIDKLIINEEIENAGMFISKLYCTIELFFKLVDENQNLVLEGHMKSRSADAEFPSFHPFDNRLKNAIESSRHHLVDFIAGEINKKKTKSELDNKLQN